LSLTVSQCASHSSSRSSRLSFRRRSTPNRTRNGGLRRSLVRKLHVLLSAVFPCPPDVYRARGAHGQACLRDLTLSSARAALDQRARRRHVGDYARAPRRLASNCQRRGHRRAACRLGFAWRLVSPFRATSAWRSSRFQLDPYDKECGSGLSPATPAPPAPPTAPTAPLRIGRRRSRGQ
jgi:hypothetical protein